MIEQTVFEQEQLQQEEGYQDRIKTTLNSDQEQINSDDSKKIKKNKHHNKSSLHKREHEKKDEHNYIKKIEYNIKIKSIIVELIRLENTQYYKIQFSTSYLDYEVLVDLKGIQVNDNHSHLQIFPLTYQEASKYARYDCFFQVDRYFNIDKKDSNNQYVFEKLLFVERQIPKNHQKSASSQEKRVVNRRWGVIADMTQILSKFQFNKFKNIANRQENYNVVNELMEVIQIFDIEMNPRFLNILFHLMMQHYFPVLREYLVFIEEIYFLFQNLPHFDCPQYYRILLFYQGMNYSLKDLHTHLDLQQLILSDLCLLKLTFSLMKIFYNCYSRYLYRLNFIPSNVYYFRRQKTFKLQSFQRINSLIPFQPDIESSLNCVSDSKMEAFKKYYIKDYLALCDLIILFKNPRGYNQKIISKMRRKKKKDEDDIQFKEYLTYIETIFNDEKDKFYLDFIRSGCNRSLDGLEFNFDFAIEEFQTYLSQVESQITQIEYKQKMKQRNQKQDYPNLDEIIQHKDNDSEDDDDEDDEDDKKIQSPIIDKSESDEQENQLLSFDFELDVEQMMKKNLYDQEDNDKDKQEKILLQNEMIYSSLLRNKHFLNNCQLFLFKDMKYSIDRLQGLIFYAQARESETLDQNERSKQFQQDLEIAISVVQKEQDNTMSTANFLALIQILQYSQRKSQILVLRLLQLCQLQSKYKYDKRNFIKKKIHSFKGIIELRKQIIIQLANVDHLMQNQKLGEAYQSICKSVEIQMKANLSRTLLFGYCLFVNGLICQETIMIQSAMITFSMSRQIYDQYFPMEKEIEVFEEKRKREKLVENKKSNLKQNFKKEEIEIISKKVLISFQNMATYNLSKLSYNLGLVFCQSNDPENALRALQKAVEYRKVIYDEFADEIIEIVLLIFKIFIENEESSSVLKMAWIYARKINQLYREDKLHYLNQKNFAKLLFLLAGIFQTCNSYFSALRFYSRANKAYTTSKTQTFNRTYFVQQQRKLILGAIKEHHLEKIKFETSEIFFTLQVRSIYDKMKPFFQQVYFVSSTQYMDNSLNLFMGSKLLYANGFFINHDHQLAWDKYQEIHKLYTAIQKDECYGHNIEKIGEIYIEQKQYDKAKQQFQYAIGIYEKYLFFPHKEYCLMRCHLQIIAVLAMQKQPKELLQQFDIVDTFILDCQIFMKWSILQEERKYNKFQLISKKAGIKILYQLIELLDLIDKFNNVRKRWFKKINDLEYLAERGFKMQKRLKGHRLENKLLAKYREQCLFGENVHIKIRKYENQVTLSSKRLIEIKNQNQKKKQNDENIDNQNNLTDGSVKNTKENSAQQQFDIKNSQPQTEIQTKSKFFLLDIQDKKKKSKKKKIDDNIQNIQELKKEENSKINSLKNLDQISSTLETLHTQIPVSKEKVKKSISQQKQQVLTSNLLNETKSKRSNSDYKKGKINPFQKLSKKQI